jgi:hypothetical protein
MMAMPWSEQFVGIALACAAVSFGALALLSGTWAMLRRRRASTPEDGGDPDDR